ncbi:amino acid-binding ACT domain-containing protein [Agromyces laixinhei]|uniref:amino acid-binding ACT domain-containing protein n=1 Tax=Agromyces laixinhei TaxID=2585717 RepID=UPI0012EE4E92|nr:amino acid-binding ACT domain-containing protein [Agromyces laixinhei]
MDDIRVPVTEGAAGLARIGAILGEARVSLEGGGMWSGIAHYLVHDGRRAADVLTSADVRGVEVREAVVMPLAEDVPGELGRMMARLADAGVRLDAQYSDHDNRKVFVVDDPMTARAVLE